MRNKHKLSNICEKSMSANCSHCGYVTIYINRPKSGKEFLVCGRVKVKMTKEDYKHVLSNICEKSKTAFCKTCGLVGILYRKNGKNGFYWKCNRTTIGGNNIKKQEYRKFKKLICELCGFVPVDSIQLDVHHIDENHSNNSPENLKTLCANCHRLQHPQKDSGYKQRIAHLLTKRWLQLINSYGF